MMTRVLINVDLSSSAPSRNTGVILGIDDQVIVQLTSDQLDQTFSIDHSLAAGRHQFFIEIPRHDTLLQDPPTSIKIESLKLQHLKNEFNVYSRYAPQYPSHWILEHQQKGIALPDVIHSNHIGWYGRWYLDFETPIYKWIHQTLAMGWLI